jgi:hypothetical protein
MNRVVAALAATLALHVSHAVAQAGHSHPGHAPKAAAADKSPPRPVPAAAPRAYASPFADYRPFDPKEPAKPWRAANEEVREAGGHVGVMKTIEAAKPAPPVDSKP